MVSSRYRSTDGPFTASENLRADYDMAKNTRWRRRRVGVAPMGSTADYHIRSEADYLRMIELARVMDNNDTIIAPVVNRAVDNTIQTGFTLDVNTGDTGADADLAAMWREYAEDADQCDIAGEHAFADQEWLTFRQMLVDGDHLVIPTTDGAVQMFEAHRVRSPSNAKKKRANGEALVHGVLIDKHRKRKEYWVTRDNIDPTRALGRVSDIKRYQARDAEGERIAFHVYNPKRVTQTRGVTAFAPVINPLAMIEDINFAKLVQAQVVSCFAIFRKRDVAYEGKKAAKAGARDTETTDTGFDEEIDRIIEALHPGMRISGEPGESFEGFSPNVPNTEYFAHVKLILTLIGINFGLPLVMVLLDAKETNFSGWRGAVDQARLGFRRNQRAMIRRFHRPYYRWWLRWQLSNPANRALREIAEKDKVNIFRHTWNPPAWPYVDPFKDATADVIRQRNAQTSPRRIAANRLGVDWSDLADEIVTDNGLAIRKAKAAAAEINKEHPDDPVHWRELLNLPAPEGMKLVINAGAGPAPTQTEDADDADENAQT